MSDPLSITASIAGITSLGCSIAKGLYQIADDMGTAGLEVHIYANEIDTFAKLLLHVQRTIDSLTCSTRDIVEIKSHIKEILDNCDSILKPLHEIQSALLPLLQHFRDSPSKLLQVALRVRWTFSSKCKVLFYRELLQRQHQMLDTHLVRAALVSAQAAKSSAPLVKTLHMSLENSMSVLNHTISCPNAAQERAHAQLRLGFSADSEITDDDDHTPAPPTRPIPQQQESSALVVAPAHSFHGPDSGPELTALTSQEAQRVLGATNLDLDAATVAGLEQMLNSTERAEQETARMASATLGGGRAGPDSQKKNSTFVFGSRNSLKQRTASDAWARCGPSMMGLWSQGSRRTLNFRQRELRLEVTFESPHFFISNKKTLGPESILLDNSPLSRTSSLIEPTGSHVQQARSSHDSPVSWLKLIYAIQEMELHYLHLYDTPVAALQKKRRSWDTVPDTVKMPYASTTLESMVVIAAMLKISWNEFDLVHDTYRAQGNGYDLIGSKIDGFGVAFTFSETTEPRLLAYDRMVPNNACKYLCFGICPMAGFYKVKNMQFLDSYRGPAAMRLGTLAAIADSLTMLGCNTATANYFRPEIHPQARHSHLFPVAFEMIGMAGCVFEEPHATWKVLPNPTIFTPVKYSTLLDLLLSTYRDALASLQRQLFSPVNDAVKIIDKAWKAAGRNSSASTDTTQLDRPRQSSHFIILDCDEYLERQADSMSSLPQHVFCVHLQVVLASLNGQETHEDDVTTMQEDGSSRSNDLSQLLHGLENATGDLTRLFIEWYVFTVRLQVVSIVCKEIRAEWAQGMRRDEFRIMAMDMMDLESRVDNIWCVLVARVLCWLQLYGFSPGDVQVGDRAKVYGSQKEVYIF